MKDIFFLNSSSGICFYWASHHGHEKDNSEEGGELTQIYAVLLLNE